MTNKIYYNWKEIEKAVNSIASQLYMSDWKPDYLVGITRGGLTAATMLSHYLGIPMHTLKVQLRDGKEVDCDHNCWMPEDIANATNVLIVDDINDSGNTLKWIRKDWFSSVAGFDPDPNMWWHERVKIAVLVNNLASEEDVDFHAIEVNKAENNCWIVFPWEEWWKQGLDKSAEIYYIKK
jgi:hypoxanthine phosphoribosyltransferase